MIDSTSLIIGVGAVIAWATVRFLLLPWVLRRRRPPSESNVGTRTSAKTTSIRIGIAVAFVLVWVVGVVSVSGGIAAGNNRDFVIAAILATIILAAAGVYTWRRG